MQFLKKIKDNTKYYNVYICECGFTKKIRSDSKTIAICKCKKTKVVDSKFYNYWRTVKRYSKSYCTEWEDFKVFEKWAIENFKENCDLVSIDENKYYSPETCKFVTRKESQQINNVTQKRKDKNLAKYGKEYYSQTEDFKNNFISGQTEESIKKRKKTVSLKYAVDNVAKSKEIQTKIAKTNIKKYGFNCVFKNNQIKNKIKNTNIENLGVEYPSQSQIVKDKIVSTNIRKFGRIHYSQTEEYKNRVKKTNLEKYGYEHLAKSPEIMAKILKSSKTTSGPELEIKAYLNSFGFNFQANYDIIKGKEIDLYDPSLKLAVEYCGVYWHSTKFDTKKDRHLYKFKECQKQNIRLITIFDDEWVRRKTRVKNLLRSVIGKNEKIYARKCSFKEIDPKTAKEFINNYHIQELKRIPQYSFGLFYDNDLVSVMTFNIHHRGLNEMVLSRFCTLQNFTIVGGGSKLLKNSLLNMGIKEVVSWSDNRYSCGDFYKNNNFILVDEYSSDYSYVNEKIPSVRFSKQSMQKSTIGCPKETTEEEFLRNLGIYRIWDCGKIKWKFIIP